MDNRPVRPSTTLRWLLPMLAAPALVLAACGTDTSPEPTTTGSATLTSTATSAAPSSTTAPTSTGTPSPTATTGATTPAEAIESWLSTQGYAYTGDCADATLGVDEGWCSTLSEDRGAAQIHKVGRVFSQYKYSLLLEKSGSTWSVVTVTTIPIGP